MALATKSYELANGFAVMSADELYFINAGSGDNYGLTPITSPSKPNGVSVSTSGVTIKDGNNTINITGNLNPSHPSVTVSCSHSK
jgi:hypothetical protein